MNPKPLKTAMIEARHHITQMITQSRLVTEIINDTCMPDRMTGIHNAIEQARQQLDRAHNIAYRIQNDPAELY
jgi:hypothetical protein